MADPYLERMDAISAALARLLKRQEEMERRLAAIEQEQAAKRRAAVAVPPPLPPGIEAPPGLGETAAPWTPEKAVEGAESPGAEAARPAEIVRPGPAVRMAGPEAAPPEAGDRAGGGDRALGAEGPPAGSGYSSAGTGGPPAGAGIRPGMLGSAQRREPPPGQEVPPLRDEAGMAARRAAKSLEAEVGLSWVNRIGALTLVLGVAFFFKYAVDNDWIGPTGRVLIGLAAGLAGLLAAERVWARGHKVFSQGIAGASAAVLYLCFYAAYSLYQLVGPGMAFSLMVASSALAGALAFRYDAQAIAVLALTGGFATPVILSTGEDHSAAFLSYLLVLDAAWVAVARVKRWAKLESLALAGTVFLYGAWFDRWFKDEKRVLAGVSALAYYGLFAASESAAVAAAAQFLTPLAEAASWSRNPTGFGLSSFLAAAGGLVCADWKKRPFQAAVALASSVLAWGLWYGDYPGIEKPRLGAFGIASALFCLFVCWLPWRAWQRRVSLTGSDLTVAAGAGIGYFSAGYAALNSEYHAWMGLFAVMIAGAYLALAYALRPAVEGGGDPRAVLLSAGLALGLLVLAAPIQFSGSAITLAWALEGAALAWISQGAGSRKLGVAALGVFVLVLARLVSIEWNRYAPGVDYRLLANARFATFVSAAAAMLAGARWLAPRGEALAPYLGGHFALLSGLGLEVAGWARRGDPLDAGSLAQVSISILMAAYGVGLIAMGVGTRTLLNRWLGLGLLALVIVKLYLVDVWEMARVYRIVAFGGLGALLLSTSYLYSHYREKIDSLFKERAGGEG